MKILIQEDKDIARAHKEYQHFTADDELRELYEARLKWQLDYNTDIEIAEKKGIEKGIEKGKLEDARNFLKLNVPLDIVLKATGLSKTELKKTGIIKK